MKKVNVKSIQTKNLDYEAMIQESKWLEDLEGNGKSVEDIQQSAREFLNFGADESFIVDAETRVKEFNRVSRSFLDINTLTNRLEADNVISSEQLAQLRAIESDLADKVGGIYGLEDDELYTTEEV